MMNYFQAIKFSNFCAIYNTNHNPGEPLESSNSCKKRRAEKWPFLSAVNSSGLSSHAYYSLN